MGKFRQMTLELWPLIEVKNCIFFVSISNLVVFDRFSSNFAYELIPARSGWDCTM